MDDDPTATFDTTPDTDRAFLLQMLGANAVVVLLVLVACAIPIAIAAWRWAL